MSQDSQQVGNESLNHGSLYKRDQVIPLSYMALSYFLPTIWNLQFSFICFYNVGLAYSLNIFILIFITPSWSYRELTQILNLWETKKIEKTHAKENNHTHKTIFTWFDNLPTSTKLQGFHYYQERMQSAVTIFSLTQTWQSHHHKTLITKVGFTMG